MRAVTVLPAPRSDGIRSVVSAKRQAIRFTIMRAAPEDVNRALAPRNVRLAVIRVRNQRPYAITFRPRTHARTGNCSG